MYLAFVDDLTVFASSKSALTKMLADIQSELARVGLKLNVEKCLWQSNSVRAGCNTSVQLDGEQLQKVNACDGFKVLGVMCSLADGMTAELRHRIRCAWAKFHEIWPVLRNRDSSLLQRIRLFNTVVGRSVLWGAASWTLCKRDARMLRTVQRDMLRRFAAGRRKHDEDYVDWIKRATAEAEQALERARLKSWHEKQLVAKWRWAGHIARMLQYRQQSWAFKTTCWRDEEMIIFWESFHDAFGNRPFRARAGR